ncbi:MAG: hypothetical protein LBD77_03510 [Bifidobacteriaceae bacterium]|jgi:hypothetical protein|nr:hypothetical protein [Bifidobacteriaceae bacterium]
MDGDYAIHDDQTTLKASWSPPCDHWEGSYSFRKTGNLIYINDCQCAK